MSMRHYPAQRIGIYILVDDLLAYCEAHQIEPAAVAEENGLLFYSEMEGTCSTIKEGELGGCEEFEAEETFYFLEVDKYPSLFRPVYASYEEALSSLKEQVEELLPENFEYEKRFVEFFGVSFG